MCLPAPLFFFGHSAIVQVQTSAFAFSLQSSGLCFVFRAQTFLNTVGAVSSPCVLRRQHWERNVVVCPYHISTLRTSNTPWFCGYRRHTHCTGCKPKYENSFHESNKFTHEKRLSHTDSSRRKCLKKINESTSGTSCSTFRSTPIHCIASALRGVVVTEDIHHVTQSGSPLLAM